MAENARPNLFDYATKELSQDAMICWLIRWSDDRFADIDGELHRCGREFVRALLRKHEETSLPERIETMIHQQDNGIDVLAAMGPDKEHVLLIEDKTGTKDHSGQLKRYYEHVIKDRSRLGKVRKENVYPIYLKTGNQSRSKDQKIERATEGFSRAYRVFNRSEFLAVLHSYKGDHQALTDYRNYLDRWENRTSSFEDWEESNQSEWTWASWEGFYQYLEDTLGAGEWSYVANPSGGFLGFWWNFIRVNGDGGPQIYLQLEADLKNNRHLLCFKVCDAVKECQRKLKWHWHKRILEAGRGKVDRPPVMRAGKSMTVGRWKGDWLAFSDGKIDLPGTVANLRHAERIRQNATG